jgi:hypothetical protein
MVQWAEDQLRIGRSTFNASTEWASLVILFISIYQVLIRGHQITRMLLFPLIVIIDKYFKQFISFINECGFQLASEIELQMHNK